MFVVTNQHSAIRCGVHNTLKKMISITNEQFRQYVSDLKRTKDIKEYIKTTISNLKELYDEVANDDAYQCSNLYSLGDSINILELLTK